MGQTIYLVDAFSHGPFTGNPAGVCPLASEPSAEWMQSVAMEMNQAETAFFWPSGGGYGLRWFTPAVEVDLCGHATLASAHVLFTAAREDARPPGAVRFFTKSGELVCRQVEGGIEMDFPDESPSAVDPFSVVGALGVEPVWMGANRMDWFFELSSTEEVLSLRPDMRLVAELGKRGVIVTAGADEKPPPPYPSPKGEGIRTDFVSRFFAPQSGIDEDPVTGSAHCALGPYWAGRLGVSSVMGFQASKRCGYVRVNVRGDRVGLVGQARTVVAGELSA